MLTVVPVLNDGLIPAQTDTDGDEVKAGQYSQYVIFGEGNTVSIKDFAGKAWDIVLENDVKDLLGFVAVR